MADIIRTGNEVLAFLDEDESVNDLQKENVQRYFEHARSHLYEYGALGHEHNYSFHHQPAVHGAVEYENKSLMPMMIALIPPDLYPSGEFTTTEVPAPQDISIRPIKTRNAKGQTMFESERTGSRVSAESGSGNTVQTQVSVATQEGGQEYLTKLKDRYQTFQTRSRKSDTELSDHNENIRASGKEVTDPATEGMKAARNPRPNEDYLRKQVLAMQNLPPLMFYVNPNKFDVSYQHIISDGDRGRQFHIIEHWGLQQPTISASGTIGATYIDSTNGLGQKTGGLTRSLRRESAAYQHFMNLFRIYKNNGYIFNIQNRISMLGSVNIYYDGTIYTGSFDSFSISEAEDKPFDLEYSFEFTVRFEDRISRTSRGEDF